MKIGEILLTNEEVVVAVTEFLAKRGMDVQVNSVSKQYTWEKEYTVDCGIKEDKTKTTPPPTWIKNKTAIEAIAPLLEEVEALTKDSKLEDTTNA